MAKDLGADLGLDIYVDATAGKGIASRRGVGKIRHLHTSTLWVQRLVQDKECAIKKIAGEDIPGDLGTKHLDSKRMWRLTKLLGIEPREGKSGIAKKAIGAE